VRVGNKTLHKRIYGPERQKITRGLKKLHGEKLHNLFCSTNNAGMINQKGREM
jgi:hypothetical protein